MGQPNNKPDGKAEIITALMGSGDAWVKLLTLALIILGGAGNWFATKNVGDESRHDWQQMRSEITQFFNNQKTYLQSLQLLQQNNADTAWIRSALQQNVNALQQNREISQSNNSELAALKAELDKMREELRKPIEQRNFQ